MITLSDVFFMLLIFFMIFVLSIPAQILWYLFIEYLIKKGVIEKNTFHRLYYGPDITYKFIGFRKK